MKEPTRFQRLNPGGQIAGRKLNVQPDMPDLRDRMYEPALLPLKLAMDPPSETMSPIGNQGKEGSCTGFALASAITLLNRRRYNSDAPEASPRMLYEMAKLHDEWEGEEYDGSSIRGALKGFYHNGVCSKKKAPYRDGEGDWYLTLEQAKEARNIGLGAYYRLRPKISDYHAALNETGVIYASARIHEGWENPAKGVIVPSSLTQGGHAFIILGYDSKGFIIQNSWSEKWGGFKGRPGIAHWSYADWAATIMDAWVLRLAVPTPEAFDFTVASTFTTESENSFGHLNISAPRESEIAGHIIHLAEGKLTGKGDKYPTPIEQIKETAKFISNDEASSKHSYRHLVFYAHGGLNSASDSANRVRKMKKVFKRNGIYPIHFMWETGFFEVLGDILFSSKDKASARVGGLADDWWDKIFEGIVSYPGKALWQKMKKDAKNSFASSSSGGYQALKVLLEANESRTEPLQIHLICHSAGSILIAHLLEAIKTMGLQHDKTHIKTCSLMAPACTVDLFNAHYAQRIGLPARTDGIGKLYQYNLTDEREQDDGIKIVYFKSLLYLVSNAFEDKKKMPLLGMEKFLGGLPKSPDHIIKHAGIDSNFTDSKTHGGFDNDALTMNDILKNILGHVPHTGKEFQLDDLKGY